MANHQANSGIGRVNAAGKSEFNGVRVFSATMVGERDKLGEKITSWLRENPRIEPRDVIVTQSSDEAFHCVTITVFYWEALE